MTTRRVVPLLAVVLLASLLVVPSAGASSAVRDCADLASGRGETETVAASSTLPAYCRVTGVLSGTVRYEVRLPEHGWNGKFFMTGCGGFCGAVNADACNFALARGYAVAATDTGHSGSGGSGVWGDGNTRAEVDWGFTAVHQVAVHAKTLVTRYFGTPASYSYFSGCSNGGRQALMEAQRFPHDFDGIIAGNPSHLQAYLAGIAQAWVELVNRDAGGQRILTVDRLPLVSAFVYESCDGVDGLVDGLIDDPRACDVDLTELRCPDGQAGATCLSTRELEVLAKLYDAPRNSAGDPLYPGGLPLGSELGWPGLSVGVGSGPSGAGNFATEYLRYLGFLRDPGPSYTLDDLDFDRDPARLARKAATYNADDPDLSAFEASGGKLILYHSWADPLITPYGTIAYYDAVAASAGGPEALAPWLRLFMLPGVYHCAGGPGPDTVDWLTALERWVEDGQAPDRVVAAKVVDGETVRTRPLYPYPTVARYAGSGSIDDADSFVPMPPASVH